MPLTGVEAIINHLIVKDLKIPAAHAPAVLPPPLSPSVCPISAAEEIGYTFLPCVLAGLSNAPTYVMMRQGTLDNGCIVASDNVVLPKDACGGDGTLAFARTASKNKPLILTVQENETVLDDTPDKFNIQDAECPRTTGKLLELSLLTRQASIQMLRRQAIDHLKSPPRLYSAHSSGPRPFAYSPMQEKVYVHQLV